MTRPAGKLAAGMVSERTPRKAGRIFDRSGGKTQSANSMQRLMSDLHLAWQGVEKDALGDRRWSSGAGLPFAREIRPLRLRMGQDHVGTPTQWSGKRQSKPNPSALGRVKSCRCRNMKFTPVTGIDISAEMIRLAEEEECLQPLGCIHRHHDASAFKPPGRADLALASYLLHCAKTADDLLRLCEACHLALRQKGPDRRHHCQCVQSAWRPGGLASARYRDALFWEPPGRRRHQGAGHEP